MLTPPVSESTDYMNTTRQVVSGPTISVGYIGLSAEITESLQTTTIDINTWPFYYAPKYLFGGESFKGFVKGAIGWQFSNFERYGALSTISDSDTGFVGGGGVGAQYFFNEKIFLKCRV